MKKKLLTLALALTLVAGTYATSFNTYAEEVWTLSEGDVSGGVVKETQVTYTQASTFTVTVPKNINIDAESKTAEYTINVLGDYASNETATVTPVDAIAETIGVIDFYMSEQSTAGVKKADVVATVTQSETVWTHTEAKVLDSEGTTVVGTNKTGTISAPSLTSGTWTGSLTFEINLIETP